MKIQVKPGWRKGTKVTFEGKGNEKLGYLPADIIFIIDEGKHPLFTREGDDLEIGVEIPLVKALTGCSNPIPLLVGDKMTLSYEDFIYPGYEKIIRGQGMPHRKDQARRGNLKKKLSSLMILTKTFPLKIFGTHIWDRHKRSMFHQKHHQNL